jgi:cytochrome c oxidase cbb3-type subunit III
MKLDKFPLRLILMILAILFAYAVKAQDGPVLYKQNCATCHSIGSGNLVGPDLKGVTEKRSEEWLVRFIKSSQEMIKAGDEEATAVFNQFGKIPMPDHMHFSDDEVKSIVAYIKDESAPTAAAVAPAPVTQVATTATTMAETATTTAPSTLAILFNGSSQSNIVLIMMGMILLLVLITVPMLIKAAIILRNLE